jgi:hypothetical protein
LRLDPPRYFASDKELQGAGNTGLAIGSKLSSSLHVHRRLVLSSLSQAGDGRRFVELSGPLAHTCELVKEKA